MTVVVLTKNVVTEVWRTWIVDVEDVVRTEVEETVCVTVTVVVLVACTGWVVGEVTVAVCVEVLPT